MNQNLKVGDHCVIVSGLLEDNIGKSVTLEVPLPHGGEVQVDGFPFLNDTGEMAWVVRGINLTTIRYESLKRVKGSPLVGIRERHLRKIGDDTGLLVKEKEKEHATG